jgi:hypothetical protein
MPSSSTMLDGVAVCQAAVLCSTVWRYAKQQYYELPANILEGITLVS